MYDVAFIILSVAAGYWCGYMSKAEQEVAVVCPNCGKNALAVKLNDAQHNNVYICGVCKRTCTACVALRAEGSQHSAC